jgi:hypothetical protein
MSTDTIPDHFLDDLAAELGLRGVPVLRSELRRWLAECGPAVAEDPAVSKWAAAFTEVARDEWEWRGNWIMPDGGLVGKGRLDRGSFRRAGASHEFSSVNNR